jgi:hypothetical protein
VEASALFVASGGVDFSETSILLAEIETLRAAGPGRAAEARAAAARARDFVFGCAGKIEEPSLRQIFLERVPENARLLAHARELDAES